MLTALIGYLEWGNNNSSFLFQNEIEVLSKLISDPISTFHPFILLPIIGQLLLIITLFQKKPSKRLSYLGLGGIGILLSFMFLVGIISLKFKIIISTIPFLVTALLVIRHHRKKNINL